jgi:hypothetical protein
MSEYFETPPQIEFAADGIRYEVIGSLDSIAAQTHSVNRPLPPITSDDTLQDQRTLSCDRCRIICVSCKRRVLPLLAPLPRDGGGWSSTEVLCSVRTYRV